MHDTHKPRAALVTGGAGGLAKGVAVGLASAGYRVAITHRPDGASPAGAVAAISAAGIAPFVVAADHSVAGETAKAVAAVEAEFGRLDVVVHMVGPIVVKRFEKNTPAEFDSMIAGNVRSSVELAAAVLPGMRARKFGRLVFFGMNGSHITQPAKGMALYGAAKAAVVTFARTLSLEEAIHGITVNVVEPGDIRDKDVDRRGAQSVPANNPTGHAGSWEDIAYAVRFLVSDEASFMNGIVIGVNGGLVEPHE